MKLQTIFSGNIAGISHRDIDFTKVGLNDLLVLTPDPHNVYDSYAVGIIHQSSGQDLGFMPAISTKAYHDANANDFPVSAHIIEMNLAKRVATITITILIAIE